MAPFECSVNIVVVAVEKDEFNCLSSHLIALTLPPNEYRMIAIICIVCMK